LADRTEAIRLNPELADAWCARGNAYYLLGKYEFAVVDLKQALRLQPGYKEANDVLRLTEEKLAQLTPEERAKRAAAPLVTREAERVQEAVAAAPPVVVPDPEPAPVALKPVTKPVAITPPVAKESPKPQVASLKVTAVPAKTELSQAPPKPPVVKAAVPLSAKPTTAEGHNLLGRQLTTAGNYQEALVELAEAIRMKPGLAPAYNARGYVYILTKQYPKAIEDLTAAIRLNPSYANAYQNRASAKRMAGDLEGARLDAEQAKKLSGQ
jgi:tetratricopeptide (TPR) repeat protein